MKGRLLANMIDFEKCAHPGTCDVCGRETKVAVCASTMGPVNHAYCQECRAAGAEPYNFMAAYIAAAGEWPDDINPNMQARIRTLLAFHGKTEEEFSKDVFALREKNILDASQQGTLVNGLVCDIPACKEQQAALKEIAAKLGVVACQENCPGELGAKNIVLFYLKEDYEHNRKDAQRSKPYPITVLTQSDRIETIQGFVHHDHFWSFQNSGADGHFNCGFANYGQIDLRSDRWKEVLEGHIRFALAKARQRQHIGKSGGWGALREADDVYNSLNRDLIAAMKLIHGTAFLGNVNFYGETHKQVALGEKSIYEEYTGQHVYSFCCSFCVPVADEELESLIQAWNASDLLPKRQVEIDAIMNRIEAIGGINLIWF